MSLQVFKRTAQGLLELLVLTTLGHLRGPGQFPEAQCSCKVYALASDWLLHAHNFINIYICRLIRVYIYICVYVV